ncbi:MAG: hydrogenase maturation protein [Gammaproteobacteria bacterium]|nr:hydrogenase maturation protein [Gammaproteobacteria bacterium]
MRILFLTHAFNSLSQRLYIALKAADHEVTVEFDINDAVSIQAVDSWQPELIIAPFLKRAIPGEIWKNYRCLVVHPGIKGDRGPSALDWAILNGETAWGVTVLQANGEMDAGAVWAESHFSMPLGTKASIYRHQVMEAAVDAITLAVARCQQSDFSPEPLNYNNPDVQGRLRPLMKQSDRQIDWQTDSTERVLRKINSADGFPGLLDEVDGRSLYLYDAHSEPVLTGKPGKLLARSGPAICRATTDGAVWIGHMRDKQSEHPFKLPATVVLNSLVQNLPESHGSYREIWYEESGDVGYLHFSFYNGAMGSAQCVALKEAYQVALKRNTRVIVLMGGTDFWSNGLHLNLIEAAESPADASWENINAIDDLAEAIITTDSHITIAALQGNAGAGGVFLARAADHVWARKGVVLNPHYKDMGNLYGSEYWTYLLPKLVGGAGAGMITQGRLPMGAVEARRLGLIDESFGKRGEEFLTEVKRRSTQLADNPCLKNILDAKRCQRASDEAKKPLAEYRHEELEKMKLNFYGFDPSYHVARYNFVYKIPKSRTPVTIARHRDIRLQKTNKESIS